MHNTLDPIGTVLADGYWLYGGFTCRFPFSPLSRLTLRFSRC
jgi:hypothetical protein